jgi:hemolysin activation/secretion protein
MRQRFCLGNRLLLVGSATAFVILALVSEVWAQQSTRQGKAIPALAHQNFERQGREAKARLDRPPIIIPRVTGSAAPPPALTPFVLRAVDVGGVQAIQKSDVSATYAEFISRSIGGTEVATIRDRITELYRVAGYHLSRAIIPPQNPKSGTLLIEVVEGAIEEVSLAGNSEDVFGVLDLLRSTTLEKPSRLETLERQLLLVNDRPGLRVTDVSLEEIGSATGRFRLIVSVQSWRLYWAQGMDNYGTPAVGPLQGYTNADFNSLLAKGDSLSLVASTVPDAPSEIVLGRAAYDIPLGSDGARFGASALQSVVRPGDERRLQNDTTRTAGYELRGSITPFQTKESSLWLTAAAGYTDASEQYNGGLLYSDKIRTVSLIADYRLRDDLNGRNNFIVTARQGIAALGASREHDPMNSRFEASGEFTAVNVAYVRLQKFSDRWSAKLDVSSQFSGKPLLLSEQYSLGGTAFGPGYYSGDNGIGGLFEFRYNQETNLQHLRGYQLYSFVDGGQVWNVNDGVRSSLFSVGVGARFFMFDELQGGIAVAVPVQNRFGSSNISDFRILFSIFNAFKNCQTSLGKSCV